MISFYEEPRKILFEEPLNDVEDIQIKGQNDIELIYHSDDTSAEKDMLEGLVFHILDDHPLFGRKIDCTPALSLKEKLISAGCTSIGDEVAVASFDSLKVLSPSLK